MKPISVRFQCFGPYMAEQFIDFTRLEAGGLFLICGETGAGKTTILDAICYALYGKSSGNLRGDFSVMRCKLAEKEETFTEFIFESCGKQYKFTRSLKMGRKNLNDSHNCLQWEDGAWVPIFENPKATAVNKKAEELIGLTYEQFRQVIILPQGQFEKLLVSNSEEKEKILVSLFHADRWQRIAEEIYRRVARQDEQLKEEKKQITYKLKEYHLESPAQLEEVGRIRREELAQMQLQAEQSR
jgi:DNA repair exonuclease SbcCD ATPase subunit